MGIAAEKMAARPSGEDRIPPIGDNRGEDRNSPNTNSLDPYHPTRLRQYTGGIRKTLCDPGKTARFLV